MPQSIHLYIASPLFNSPPEWSGLEQFTVSHDSDRLALNDLSHMSGAPEEMAKTSSPFSLSSWNPSLTEAGLGLLKGWQCSRRARWEALRPHEVEAWKFSSIISYVFFSKASHQPHPESRDGEMTPTPSSEGLQRLCGHIQSTTR